GEAQHRRQHALEPGQVPVGALGEHRLHVDAEMRGVRSKWAVRQAVRGGAVGFWLHRGARVQGEWPPAGTVRRRPGFAKKDEFAKTWLVRSATICRDCPATRTGVALM